MVPGVTQPFYFLLQGTHCSQCFLMGLVYRGQTPFHQIIFPSSVGDATPRGMGAFRMGAMPWLQEPFPPHIFGGLGGRTALLQVLLTPQEQILAVYAAYKLPNITLVALPLLFLAPPAKWQICPPQGSAEACSAGSLGR